MGTPGHTGGSRGLWGRGRHLPHEDLGEARDEAVLLQRDEQIHGRHEGEHHGHCGSRGAPCGAPKTSNPCSVRGPPNTKPPNPKSLLCVGPADPKIPNPKSLLCAGPTNSPQIPNHCSMQVLPKSQTCVPRGSQLPQLSPNPKCQPPKPSAGLTAVQGVLEEADAAGEDEEGEEAEEQQAQQQGQRCGAGWDRGHCSTRTAPSPHPDKTSLFPLGWD